MFIYGYYVVNLTKDQRPEFPDRCVVCGRPVHAFRKVFSSLFIPADLLIWNAKEVPAHADCAKGLLSAHYLTFLGFAIPAIIFFLYLLYGIGIGTIVAISISFIFIMASAYGFARSRWKLKSPLPFRFFISQFSDEVSYAFLDKEYAKEFARLNNTVIAPG